MADRSKLRGTRFVGLGLELAAAVAGLTLVGYWLDKRYGTSPWALLIGVGIGLVGGMYNMIRQALAAVGPRQHESGPASDQASDSGRE